MPGLRDDWNPLEDGRSGAKGTQLTTLDGKVTTFLVALNWPTRSIARLTIRQEWGGAWTVKQGRIWPDLESEDDGA